jgi:benzodiazapine receptor
MNAVPSVLARETMKPVLAWLIAAAVIATVVAAGVAFPPDAWYAELRKPTWQPPNALFGPVWTTLYLLMMVALALLLQAPAGARRTHALSWFAAQLVLNAAWTPLFFGLHQPLLAFVAICLLWLTLLASIFAAFAVRGLSAWLLVPTLLWVSFALVLNGVIVALN